MSKFFFYDYIDYEEGRMAHVCTTDMNEIPLNIHIDNDDEFPDLKDRECEINVAGVTGDIQVYPEAKAFYEAGTGFYEKSLIPVGTFSVPGNEDTFRPSADVIFTGQVLDVQWNPDSEPGEPNCCILIETLGFEFSLFLEYDGEIEKGYIVSGSAWLFGEIGEVYPKSEYGDIADADFDEDEEEDFFESEYGDTADPDFDEDEEEDFFEIEPGRNKADMICDALGSYVRLTCRNTDLCARYEGRIDEYTVRAPGWISSVRGHFLGVGDKSFYPYDIQDIEVLEGTEADVLRGKITGETIQEYILPLTDAQIAFLADEMIVDLEDFPFLPKDKIGDIHDMVIGIEAAETAAAEREHREISQRGRTAAEIAAALKEMLGTTESHA